MSVRLRRKHHGRQQFLDLAPMVDVTLTLIVFLLLNSESMDIRNITVHLPQAASAQSEEQAIAVHVDAAGEIMYEGKPLSLDAIADTIASGSRVTIYADQDAKHGRVTAVVDHLRAAGIEHIFYGVEAVDTW